MTTPALPEIIDFDPNDLTLGEMEEIETAAGVPFQSLVAQFEKQEMTTRAMRAVLWILIRRSNPDYTFEDTANVSIGDLDKLQVEDDEDPLASATSGEEE